MEPAFTRLPSIVEALVPILVPFSGLPFAFFGHSMGALLSFELARQLRRQGERQPFYLFVSARRAPHLPRMEPPVHHLSDPEFLERIRRLNGTPEPVLQSEELMQLLLPTLRADSEVYETYVYSSEPPLDSPISAFGGLQDTSVSQEEVAAWERHTRGSFKRRMLEGDHFFLNTSRRPLLDAIAQDLGTVA